MILMILVGLLAGQGYLSPDQACTLRIERLSEVADPPVTISDALQLTAATDSVRLPLFEATVFLVFSDTTESADYYSYWRPGRLETIEEPIENLARWALHGFIVNRSEGLVKRFVSAGTYRMVVRYVGIDAGNRNLICSAMSPAFTFGDEQLLLGGGDDRAPFG